MKSLPDEIKFTKMHGNGNDFVVIDEFNEILITEELKPDFVKTVCDRRFGVGGDGLIFIQPSERADVRFRYFNSDGGEAEMCGNGIRCFSRFVVEEKYVDRELKVETLAGIKELKVSIENGEYWIRVDMGKPEFESDKIPAKDIEKSLWEKEFDINGGKYRVYAVNTGVPHAVIFVESFNFEINEIARKIRYSEFFPTGINVNFVKVKSKEEIEIRTYERGVEDETLSCGTGSVASAVVANKLNMVLDSVKVKTKGGILRIEIEDSVYMTGTANSVFDGVIRLKELKKLNYED
ncbi:MAG TPA: diaminopimelate epimerase [Archaeoglobaceae archaeon]|nr:diaminopimelate epimerase [Archaeoglobaceae archaeon]